jgi:hypothetical protein
MRGKTTSSEKKAEVIMEKIKNPDASSRDLAKKTGVNRNTANTIVKEELGRVVPQSENIAKLIDSNSEILSLSDDAVVDRLKKDVDHPSYFTNVLRAKDLAFKQNQLLTDRPTNNIKVSGDLTGLTDEELKELMK